MVEAIRNYFLIDKTTNKYKRLIKKKTKKKTHMQ